MMCDVFKDMGHDVHIVARTQKKTRVEVNVPILDPKNARPVLIPAQVEASCKLAHHPLHKLGKFQPLKFITPNDISLHDIPVVYWGDHFLTPWAPEVVEMIEEADYVFCDTEMYIRLESSLDIADKHIQFVHFPTQGLMPVLGREPKRLWANSSFTQSWIRIRWGYNNLNYHKLGKKYATVKMPRQIYQSEVVHPPLYIEDYENNNGFDDRPYDVVMFARLGDDKFTVSGFLNKHFKLLTMGALSPVKQPGQKKEDIFKPEGELHPTVTFKQVIQLLKQAKVYAHGKGFGLTKAGGESLAEHFGITACEAASAGCALVVPRKGGIWTDIAEYGKYCLGYSSLEELRHHVSKLISERKYWNDWSQKSLESVKRFDASVIRERVKYLINHKS